MSVFLGLFSWLVCVLEEELPEECPFAAPVLGVSPGREVRQGGVSGLLFVLPF